MSTTTLDVEVPGRRCHGHDKMYWYDQPAEFDAAQAILEAAGWIKLPAVRRKPPHGIVEYAYRSAQPEPGGEVLADKPTSRKVLRLRVDGTGWRWVESLDEVRALAARELASYDLVDYVDNHGYYDYFFQRPGRTVHVLQLALEVDLDHKPRRQLLYRDAEGGWQPYGPAVPLYALGQYNHGPHCEDNELPHIRLEFGAWWSANHPGAMLPERNVFYVLDWLTSPALSA